MPAMRPLLMEYPNDASTFKMDDQWMVGSSLLVKPVTEKGAAHVDVYLPGNQDWYDLYTLARIAPSPGPGVTVRYDAPLETIPVFVRPGTVIPRKMRLRRSSKLMFYDPYTLVVAPDAQGQASGSLYLDDEHSLAHETAGMFAVRSFTYVSTSSTAVMTCTTAVRPIGATSPSEAFTAPNTVERIILGGQRTQPTSIVLTSVNSDGTAVSTVLTSVYEQETGVLTIKKPNCLVVEDWTVTIES